MHKINLLPFAIATALMSLSPNVFADLSTNRPVVSNDGNERVTAKVKFQTPVNGDLYIATRVNGELLFLADEGTLFTTAIVPYRANSHFSGDFDALDISGQGINPGRYPLYQVVTQPGSDPLNFMNWIGGLGGLSTINFNIGLPVNLSGDFDKNGFSDDDHNHDGFHDDDNNRDGLHDDDNDHNGFHDDDLNHDGFHDDDLNHDDLHDQDNNLNDDHGNHRNDPNHT
jgi:hypothetical protein